MDATTSGITAYSYLRFSKPEQAKGDSIRRQTRMTEDLCKRNGWQLSELPPDKGLSGFSGRNLLQGNLGKFLSGVQSGKIKTPCVLVIEQVDRLTRLPVLRKAIPLIVDLVEAGVTIATTRPEAVYDAKSINDAMTVMGLIMGLSLAHDESAKKSERLKSAWASKRADTHKLLGGKLPHWLQMVDGKVVPVPEKVKIVNRVVKLAIDGVGNHGIARTLNREGIPNLLGKGVWHGANLNAAILRNRRLIGEFQPCRIVDGKRVPDGPPRSGYFPAVVSEADFANLQIALDRRKKARAGGQGMRQPIPGSDDC